MFKKLVIVLFDTKIFLDSCFLFIRISTAKFWNSKYRQTCPITDDSKGITLQSLGGIFLATLVGLLLSMITLAYEVWQQKKKEKETNKVRFL